VKRAFARILQSLLDWLDPKAKGNVLTPEQYGMALKGATLGFFDWDIPTNHYQADESWLALLGYQPGELETTPDTLRALTHPADREITERRVLQAIAKDDQFAIEFRGLHKQGYVCWMRTVGSVLKRDRKTGAPLRVCGAMQDISSLKRHELERDEFLKFFQLSSHLMMISTVDGKVLKVNQAALDTFGYTEDEHYTMNVMDLVHPDDLERTRSEIGRQMQTGHTLQFENRCRCKDGSYRWLSYRATYDPVAELSYVTALDVTDSKRIQEELRQHQNRYLALVNHTNDVIMEFDRAHRHIYVNDVVTEIIGMPPSAFLGKTHDEMGFPKHLCELWEDAIERVFHSGKPYTTYFEADNPGGSMRVDWSVFPGLVIDGEVITVLNVSRDITQYMKMEEELLRMQKLSSLGVLAGGIAHDFNNILTILFGNIALAKSMLGDGHVSHDALEKAEVAFHRATHLTGQLLTFAKGGEPVKQDVSIKAVIEEVVRFDLSGSNVKLVFESPADLWRAWVDKGQVSQVFSNLATNALQAMPQGGHLYISIENCRVDRGDVPGLHEGNYLRFLVRDEGGGIKAEHLDKIFDPYFTTKNKGSGLGLATVHSIVSRHGGHISVESEEGNGTRFTLYLPASGKGIAEKAAQPAARPVPQSGQARILLMDDEDMICQLCTTYLTGRGMRVDRARDGREAIRMYFAAANAGQRYDCLIMDLTIPGGMSGKDALVEIRNQDTSVRAIVSSGYAADPVMANFREYGFRGFMPKPFKLAALHDEIVRVLGEAA